jgi:hypothetical protein
MSQTGMARGNVVLVHGSSTDGSGWEGVYELLALGVFIWLLQAWVTHSSHSGHVVVGTSSREHDSRHPPPV